jgi:hypothetical protein
MRAKRMGVGTTVIPAVGTTLARLAALNAAAEIQRLLLLDDLWSDLLERARRGEDTAALDDIESMEMLVTELDAGLSRLKDSAYALRQILDATPHGEFAEALARLAEQPESPPHLLARLEAALPDYELRSAAIEACDYVLEEIGNEMGLLYSKLERLREGEVPEGDFRLTFRCALFLASAGASVVGTIGLGGAPVYVGLAVAGALGPAVLAWESTCRGRLAEVTRGRR